MRIFLAEVQCRYRLLVEVRMKNGFAQLNYTETLDLSGIEVVKLKVAPC